VGALPRDESFDVVFRRLFPRAVELARRIVGDASAEDVAAEALARALERWNQVRDLEYVDAWVLRVAANLSISEARKRPPKTVQLTDNPGLDPASRLALVAALAKIPRRQREAICLRYLGGFSEREVAQALGCAPGTLKSHLHRGLTGLRRQLGEGDRGGRTCHRTLTITWNACTSGRTRSECGDDSAASRSL